MIDTTSAIEQARRMWNPPLRLVLVAHRETLVNYLEKLDRETLEIQQKFKNAQQDLHDLPVRIAETKATMRELDAMLAQMDVA